MRVYVRRSANARFDEKVRRTESCWLWTAATRGIGYGAFSVGNRKDGDFRHVQAHRFAYERWVGPIPEGLQIDHLCGVPQCVNPEHLEVVTQRENSLRSNNFGGRNARKTHCPKGHEYDFVNTNGRRSCRRCLAASQRRYQRRKSKG